jgi:TolB protein
MRRAWVRAAVLALATAAGCGSDDDGQPAAGPGQPGGRLVVLSWPQTGERGLVLIDLESGQRRLLTDRPGPGAAFSRDGRRLVYEVGTGGTIADQGSDLFIAGGDGTDPRRLSGRAGSRSFAPAFTPDGGAVVFATNRDTAVAGFGPAEIYRIEVDGRDEPRRLTDRPATHEDWPAVHPRDGRIAFVVVPEDEFEHEDEVFEMPARGGEARPLTSNNEAERQPRFSPDGTTLAFVRDLDSTMEDHEEVLVVADAGGGNEVVVSGEPGTITGFDFAPDGRLVFGKGPIHGEHEPVPGNHDIFVVGPDGRGLRHLTDDPERDSGPVVSPDGLWVAFTRQAAGGDDVYVAPIDGGDLRPLVDGPGSQTVLAWGGR